MRRLLATLVCIAGLVGCGQAADTGPVDPAGDAAAGAVEPGEAAGPVRIEVQVSGGIAGLSRSYVVDTSQPPQRLSEATIDRLVELAGSEAVRGYAGNHVEPGECCDLMEYRVLIEHADGSTTEIVTNDADSTPRAYARLLSIVTDIR